MALMLKSNGPRRVLGVVRRQLETVVIASLPRKYANLLQCSEGGLWNDYFRGAENSIDRQWESTIWPLVKQFDFSSVLELAPGAGRNTERLCEVSQRLYAVDFNAYAIEQCQKRLGPKRGGCELSYHVNNGSDLRMIEDSSITAIYCWDAAVHFDRSVIETYIPEFARILKPGGQGFVHHSNLGDRAHKDIKRNPHWRSNMSKEAFVSACDRVGLSVNQQRDVPWGTEVVDCATVFSKPR